MMEHTFPTSLSWTGSTAEGIRHYSRSHSASAGPGLELDLTADPHFRGVPERLNPEQLLVLAASSCQLLSFLAVAAREGVDVLSYQDDAVGRMPMARSGMRISTITLRPRIVVAPGTDLSRMRELLEQAHQECFIANSLTTQITIEPEVSTAGTTAEG